MVRIYYTDLQHFIFHSLTTPPPMLHFTHIYEAARAALNITRDEYALCNFIKTLSSNPSSSRPGWCDSTREQKADFVGISVRGLDGMEERMVALGLIEKARRHTRTTQLWWDTVELAKTAANQQPAQSAGLGQSAQSAGLESAQSAGLTGTNCTLNLHKLHTLRNNKRKENNTGSDVSVNDVFALSSSPKAGTPDELFNALAGFYKAWPQEWSTGIMASSKGSAWSQEERGHIVRTFARWAIESGKGTDTYQQLNARLQRWFSDQYLRRQSGQGLGGIPTAPQHQAAGSGVHLSNPAFKPL